MKDIYRSKKQSVWIRRIEIAGVAYTVRPSFIMPYLVGYVDEIEAALFLRKFNVPFWAVSYVFGKDHMYWYRIEQSIGRNSIVGTTVRNPEDIPKDYFLQRWLAVEKRNIFRQRKPKKQIVALEEESKKLQAKETAATIMLKM